MEAQTEAFCKLLVPEELNQYIEKGIKGKYLSSDSPYFFVALVARRCLNFLDTYGIGGFTSSARIVTDNGCMLLMDEVAQIYHKTGLVPRMLILDDVLVHGRAVSRLINNLYSCFLKCLGAEADAALYRSFLKAIDIEVLIENSNTLMALPDVQQRIRALQHTLDTEWREISSQITSYIRITAQPNTSFVMSAYCDKIPDESPKNGWKLISHSLQASQRNKSKAYMRCYMSSTAHPTVATIRIHPSLDGHIWITPLLCNEKLTLDQQHDLFLKLIDLLTETNQNFTALLSLLHAAVKHELDSLCNNYYQLLVMLLSHLVLLQFIKDQELSIQCMDNEKIAWNFGGGKELSDEFNRLALLDNFDYESLLELMPVNIDKLEPGSMLDVDEYCYELGINGEQMVEKHMKEFYQAESPMARIGILNRDIYTTSDSNSFCLCEKPLVNFVTDAYNLGGFSSVLQSLCSLLEHMDSSTVALCTCYDGSCGQMVLRHTEMSLCIYPQKTSLILPALRKIYSHCNGNKNTFLQEVSRYRDVVEENWSLIVSGYEERDHILNYQMAMLTRFTAAISKHFSIADSLLGWSEASLPLGFSRNGLSVSAYFLMQKILLQFA